MSFAAVLVGIALIVGGVAAYLGRWRRWAFARPVFSYAVGFGVLYVGIAMTIFGILTLLGDAVPLGVQRVGAVVVLALMAMMLLSLFWFPAFLTPRWFRTERAAQRGARHGASS